MKNSRNTLQKLTLEDIRENIVIIKINKSFREGMSETELYDVTRGCWKRKIASVEKADYALAVVYGIVKEVYQIDEWLPAKMRCGKLFRTTKRLMQAELYSRAGTLMKKLGKNIWIIQWQGFLKEEKPLP